MRNVKARAWFGVIGVVSAGIVASTEGCSSGSSGGSSTVDSGTDSHSSSTGSTGGVSSGTTSSSSGASSSTSSSSGTTSSSSSSGGDAGCSGSTSVALTVKDYKSWCNISVNGGTPRVPDQTVCVAAGSTVNLSLTAESTTFEIGPTPWHGTSGDHGSGDPGMLEDGGSVDTTTVVIPSGATTACVWACCPFTDGTGCTTPTPAPCP